MARRKIISKHYDSSYMKQPSFMGIYINDLVSISTVLFVLSRFLIKSSIAVQYTAYATVGIGLYGFLVFRNTYLPKDYIFYLLRKITSKSKKKVTTREITK